MSKQRETASPAPMATIPPAAPTTDHGPRTTDAPARVRIGDCIGLMVECPVCKSPAAVTHARGARTQTQVISSKWWVLTKCKGACGSVLRKVDDLVHVLEQPAPPVIRKPLGAAVGSFIVCPADAAHGRARAAWSLDDGHTVQCPDCGTRPYSGETVVEILG